MKIIRGWAWLTHFVAKKWSDRFGSKKIMTDESGMPIQKKESFFLHSIGEYKTKLKKIKQNLKEKDQTKL